MTDALPGPGERPVYFGVTRYQTFPVPVTVTKVRGPGRGLGIRAPITCVLGSALPSRSSAQVSLSRGATSELRGENGTLSCSARLSCRGRSLHSASVLLVTGLCCFFLPDGESLDLPWESSLASIMLWSIEYGRNDTVEVSGAPGSCSTSTLHTWMLTVIASDH